MANGEEDYIVFGSALPEIEDEATLKKRAAKELQVCDEKGRQRFHGAFTGGFSAGYFNTVGTKEGWTPSTFVSSRDKKSDHIQQNPEDFMDDEDFGEFGIATRKIHTTSNFQDTSEKKDQKRKFFDTDTIIPGEAPLKDIIQPVRESVGITILRKLGWREGQGIGPRLKKANAGAKIYGCSPFPHRSIEEEDPMAAMFTFAPKDIESTSYKSKENYFGFGYTGLSKQPILNAPVDPFASISTKSWLAKDKRKLKISGQAFGVGAFEDDDEDIYGKDNMAQYDFSELDLKRSENSLRTIEASKHGKSHDVLEGFHLAVKPPEVKKHYPPPTLPSYFNPMHLKNTCSTSQKPAVFQSRHSMSASDRSLILGEKKFQKTSLNDSAEVQKKMEFQKAESLPSSTTVSSNFHPFSNDAAKQHRYGEYLKLKETGNISKLIQPSSMTEWEKQQEIEEFSKAAVLFKPLSNVLSSRFESRSNLSTEHEIIAALEKIRKGKKEETITKKFLVGKSNRKTSEWHPVSLLCKRMNVPNPYPNSDSSRPQNVFQSKSVFSHLTFTSEKSKSPEKSVYSVSTDNSMLTISTVESNKDECDEVQKHDFDKAESDKNNKAETSSKNNEDSSSVKPPMDFFKDIFENSSSDEDNEKEEKAKTSDKNIVEQKLPEFKKVEEIPEKQSSLLDSVDMKTVNEVSKNSDLNNLASQKPSITKKVGFGVFANLDLDSLNQRKPVEKNLQKTHLDVSNLKSRDIKTTVDANSEEHVKYPKSDDTYGPDLPPDYSDVPLIASDSASLKKHPRSKSSHKHKHHKHKHKKKKKKVSKKDFSSSDSSEQELDDIPPSLIIEKMKKLQRKSF